MCVGVPTLVSTPVFAQWSAVRRRRSVHGGEGAGSPTSTFRRGRSNACELELWDSRRMQSTIAGSMIPSPLSPLPWSLLPCVCSANSWSIALRHSLGDIAPHGHTRRDKSKRWILADRLATPIGKSAKAVDCTGESCFAVSLPPPTTPSNHFSAMGDTERKAPGFSFVAYWPQDSDCSSAAEIVLCVAPFLWSSVLLSKVTVLEKPRRSDVSRILNRGKFECASLARLAHRHVQLAMDDSHTFIMIPRNRTNFDLTPFQDSFWYTLSRSGRNVPFDATSNLCATVSTAWAAVRLADHLKWRSSHEQNANRGTTDASAWFRQHGQRVWSWFVALALIARG